MDAHYNIAQATRSLNRYMRERMDDECSSLQLLNMFQDDDAEPFSVIEIGRLGRLVFQNEQGAQEMPGRQAPADEVVVALQGIVTGKELPPFKINKINPSKIGLYRQGVTVAIVDDSAIDEVLGKIGRVQNLFKRHYGDMLQDGCSFSNNVAGQISYSTFDIYNRIFKKKGHNDDDQIKAMASCLDSNGLMEQAANTNGFVHTSDNEVHYFERKKDLVGGDHKFVVAEPTIFQIGDIVEVQLSFVALPLHQKKYKLSLILRSVGLIDAQYSKASAIDKFKSMAKSTSAQPQRSFLKRSIGYAEENMSIAQTRMSTMHVDDTNEIRKSKNADRRIDKAGGIKDGGRYEKRSKDARESSR